ncbi:hypothetical protein SAMD00019534_109280 [Acytostelium subglobosum LB1]|uniref:hypothetical protein n=1 Tax=Acytostelium subglobosum LB1 TaxID=1410327 RepID=UPI000644E0DA|nr:hypothetical protein SAMD00019534_109280 [Acytostelium subglobosum LB1]GAM27752.1 hypothetical protein SAMD00019534_109280 [Acytostelium subglobosum LB1]|eukprot:XP_012749411.1 hypothetical protein SAMD00019534_109280 [Acytostelium subglobosum LB1]
MIMMVATKCVSMKQRLRYMTATAAAKKKLDDPFDKRLEQSWEHLQSLATSYKIHDAARGQIVDHYRQLHESLVLEEHKKKAPITSEMERTEEAMTSIAKNLDEVHTFFNKANGTGDTVIDTVELIKAITSSRTVNQFIKKIHRDSGEGPVEYTDRQLLSMVLKSDQLMSTNKYQPSHTYSTSKREYTDNLTGVSHTEIEVIGPPTSWMVKHKFTNHIFGFYSNGLAIYDPAKCKWSNVIRNTPQIDRKLVDRAMVYARNNIYVFGGAGKEDTYAQYSLVEHKWFDNLPIVGPSLEDIFKIAI